MSHTRYDGVVTYNTLPPYDALSLAISNNDLDGVKYISTKQGWNYVDKIYGRYENYYNWQSSSLSKAIKLKDLMGIQSFYKKMGYSHDSLYTYYNLESKKEAAAEFRDLRGLYCIWLAEMFFCALQKKYNYTFKSPPKFHPEKKLPCEIENSAFLTQFHAFPDIKELKIRCNKTEGFQEWIYNTNALRDSDLRFAVTSNDIDAIVLMQEKLNETPNSINLSSEELKESLSFAYHKKNLPLAEEIIKLGAEFEPTYIFRSNGALKKTEYQQHIKNITVSTSQKETALSIVGLMFLKPLSNSEEYKNICFVIDSIADYSYTPDNNVKLLLNTLVNLLNKDPIVSGILIYIALLNHHKTQHTPLKVFVADDLQASFRRDVIIHPYKDYCVHSETKNLNSKLVHEASHSILYFLFDNSCKPFFRIDSDSKKYRYTQYKQAELDTILKIYNFIGETPEQNCSLHDRPCYKNLIKQLNDSILMDLNMLHELRKWHQTQSNQEIHSKDKLQRETLNVMLDYFVYMKKKGITIYGKYHTHDSRIEFLKDAIKKQKWSEDQIVVLSRFHECLGRNKGNIEENIEIELIVRLPELLASDNSAVSELFSPLKKYWEEFISPEIENSIKVFNIDECTSISCVDECKSENSKADDIKTKEDLESYLPFSYISNIFAYFTNLNNNTTGEVESHSEL